MLMTTFYILYNTVAISPNIVGYKFTLYTVFYIRIMWNTFVIFGSLFKLIVI